jgi:hypothetical protein
VTSPGSPLLAFHSSPEFYHSGAVAADHVSDPVRQLPPLRFRPLRRFPDNGQLHNSRRLPTLGLRCLLSVSHALKAFFRPLSAGLVSCRSRPWGFPFRVFLTPGAIHSLELLSPLVVSSPPGLCFRRPDPRPLGYGRFPQDNPSRSNASFGSPHFRVFVPVSARPSGANNARKNATLLGFHLPKGFPLSPAGLPRSPFLSRASPPIAHSTAAPQSFPGKKFDKALSSLSPLPRFATFSADPTPAQSHVFRGCPSGNTRCCHRPLPVLETPASVTGAS